MEKTSNGAAPIKKKALVFSGGTIKGAFQAGAVKAVLESGFEPDIIQGISAGALNAAVLTNETGKQPKAPNWLAAAQILENIWLQQVRQPSDIVETRSKFNIAMQFIRNRFESFLKNDPLKKKLYRILKEDYLRKSPVHFMVGAVDLLKGEIDFRSNKELGNLIDYVLASASIPVVLPATYISNKPYVDGGLRDSAPLKRVIEAGAEEIVIILTHPKEIEDKTQDPSFDPHQLFHLIKRSIHIMLQEMLENDIEMLEKVNSMLTDMEGLRSKGGIQFLEGKRPISYTLIRPEKAYSFSINDFKQADIHTMFQDGYRIASLEMGRQKGQSAA